MQGIYFGQAGVALEALREAGLLHDLDPNMSADPWDSDVGEDYPFGLRLRTRDSIYDIYFEVGR